MIFKSIKWRLQLWYGLILVSVLAGFGVTAYQLERNRQFRVLDDELHRRVGALAQTLHGPPRRGPQAGDQGGPMDGFPPPPGFGDDGPPVRQQRPARFTPTTQILALFDTNSPNQFYYVIQSLNGNAIGHSDFPQPTVMAQARTEPRGDEGAGPRGDRGPLQIGPWREMGNVLPSGEWIRVGCSTTPEQNELRKEAWMLTGVGGIVLLLGVAGGWWFVGRALRPIAGISATAAKIASGDLAQRIDTAEAESELGQLASVLNSTFARLETAFAQQKQFASDAAHELRTPVTVILTQTQMALSRDRDAAAYKQTLEACQRAAQRMRKLIETLLELARFDAGQEVLKHLKFDLAETVADCTDMIQPLAEERKVKITANLAPLEISGDPERLGQVVTNLLTNAIQHNQPEGEVRLKLEAQNGLAVLEISDTGKGIAAKDLPRIFERFYRADNSRTGAGNSGLGLSICKAIVEAHGGTIEASSVESEGTTFTVRLPGS
jgi:two-component system OmpR family sensor kinase